MRVLFAVAALALATPALAEPVELPVKVADGATWTIESRRVRVQERKDGPKRTETLSRYQATYRETKTGARLTLKPLDGGSFLGEIPAGLKLDGFDFPLEVDVDEAMTPTRLRNWPQVKAAVYEMIGGMEPQVVEGMRGLFEPLSDEQAAAMFLQQMGYLGLGQGLALEPGKPLPYEDTLPNPLGGPAIKAQSTFTLERHGGGEASLVWTQALDRESMAASMQASVKILFERMKVPTGAAEVEAAMREAQMSRNGRCEFTVDIATGLARKAACTQLLEMSLAGEKTRREDTWTITQSMPGKP